MTRRDFRAWLLRRAVRVRAPVPEADIAALYQYFEMLSKWNATINLTALPLDPPTNATFDRLFIEPLAAAQFFPTGVRRWMDVGSGNGSPALPLRLACDAESLTMVESKARKAAFLREAIRTVPFARSTVVNARLEDFDSNGLLADAITIRAVKVSQKLTATLARLLSPRGWLLLFQPTVTAPERAGFQFVDVHPLIAEAVFLARYRCVFHVERR